MTSSKKCTVRLSSFRTGRLPLLLLALLMALGFAALFFFAVGKDRIFPDASLPTPVFSSACGFYDDDFYLSLQAEPGYDIYYTVDGSEPDKTAIKYEQPLLIEDATKHENLWSMRTDVSAGFNVTEENAPDDIDPPGYMAPDFPVDKCTVIRAVCVSAAGAISKTVTRSFFVGYRDRSGYDQMYVMSVVTDPDNLFDYNDGIYVTGAVYDDYIHSGTEDWTKDFWWWQDANYRLKGKAHEKPAYLEVYNAEHQLLFTKDVGIRVQGGGSRGSLPRSFNFFARDEYDGTPLFPDNLFPSGYAPDVITAFAGGDGKITKLNDYLASSLTSDRKITTMSYIPCVMFLDGEYWGVYWITEKYDGTFLNYYYGAPSDDVLMIKQGAVEVGSNKNLRLYRDLKTTITHSDMSNDADYEKACRLVDIDSFIDYYAVQCYLARHNDWPKSNIALWRTKNRTDDAYADSRWRWMLFDVNSGAFDLELAEEDTVKRVAEEDRMFARFIKNKSFEKRFYQTLLDLAQNCFDPASVEKSMTRYKSFMPQALQKEFARFYGKDNTLYEEAFLPKVEEMEQFLEKRYHFMLDYCHAHLAT